MLHFNLWALVDCSRTAHIWNFVFYIFIPVFLFLQTLHILYSKTLATLQRMPQDAAYRKYTEPLINERFNHVQTVSKGRVRVYRCMCNSDYNEKKCLSQQEPDIEKLEKKLNCGQIEEIVFQVCRHTLSCSVITNKKYRFNIKSCCVEMSNTYWWSYIIGLLDHYCPND